MKPIANQFLLNSSSSESFTLNKSLFLNHFLVPLLHCHCHHHHRSLPSVILCCHATSFLPPLFLTSTLLHSLSLSLSLSVKPTVILHMVGSKRLFLNKSQLTLKVNEREQDMLNELRLVNDFVMNSQKWLMTHFFL